MGKKPIGGGTPNGPLIGDQGLLDGLIANMRSGRAFVDPMEKKKGAGGGGEVNFLAGLKKTKRSAPAGGEKKEEGGEINFLAGLKKAKRPVEGGAHKEEEGEINFLAGLKKTRRPAEGGGPKPETEVRRLILCLLLCILRNVSVLSV